jgi:hypothetical protein
VKTSSMKIPSLVEAQALLEEAEKLNPGPWINHSRHVAEAAQLITRRLQGLDPEAATILGLLHDIGRREGVTDLRHILDGYAYMQQLGYADVAKICLTHSFPDKNFISYVGKSDCNDAEIQKIQAALDGVEFDDYDRLIQLCDALALPDGICLLEKRLVDVTLRYGINEYSVIRWKCFMNIQNEFEKRIGESIYNLLPGVVENTFQIRIYDGKEHFRHGKISRD